MCCSCCAAPRRPKAGDGLSLLVTEKGPAVEVAKLEEKLGIHGSATAVVNFDGAHARLLGGRGEGLYKVTLALLHNVRLEVAAQAIGIAEAAQIEAARYASERKQFGRSIDSFAPVRTMLFDNAIAIEAARAVVYTTAAIVDRRRGLHRSGGGADAERYWAKNVGWRIDYQIATPSLAACAVRESIFKRQRFSDHAPLTIDYDWPLD